MALDQQVYYMDPYFLYGPEHETFVPLIDDGYDPNYGYDPNNEHNPNYGYGPQEDTESEKQRKEQEEKERLEALESNRLYLRKVKKQCMKEDFADLDKLQLFLFEVLIEDLEVNSESELGLIGDNDNPSLITARVQFLNSPYLEICEKDVVHEGSSYRVSNAEENYLKTIGQGQGGLYSTSNEPPQDHLTWTQNETGSGNHECEERVPTVELVITTKWENASGKSCLFSETALVIVQDLEKYPVNLQVLRCVTSASGAEFCEPLGHAQLRLPEDFGLSVIQACKPGVVLPVSAEHRQSLNITNVFGVKKGKVDLFVRLSTFGPVIITSFQASGPARKYVFKPSPLDTNFKHPEEHEPTPVGEVLKPLIAQEEDAYGISVQKEYDIFQKPVLWKNVDPYKCGCKDGGNGNEGESRLSSLGSLRLPVASDLSLCKNIIPPSIYRKLKFQNKTCDWHNLVSSEIKNSPGGNCGCLDSRLNKTDGTGTPDIHPLLLDTPRPTLGEDASKEHTPGEIHPSRVSRLQKMIKPLSKEPGVKGFGIRTEDTDCGCPCPYIKEALKNNELF